MKISTAGWVVPAAGVTSALAAAAGIYVVAMNDMATTVSVAVRQVGDKTSDKTKDKVENKTFQISGSISGLYPDVAGKTLTLQLTNGASQRVTVTSLTVTAADAANGCSASNVLFGQAGSRGAGSKTFTTNVPLESRGTAPYVVDVTMASNAENICASSNFTLTYTGTAVQS